MPARHECRSRHCVARAHIAPRSHPYAARAHHPRTAPHVAGCGGRDPTTSHGCKTHGKTNTQRQSQRTSVPPLRQSSARACAHVFLSRVPCLRPAHAQHTSCRRLFLPPYARNAYACTTCKRTRRRRTRLSTAPASICSGPPALEQALRCAGASACARRGCRAPPLREVAYTASCRSCRYRAKRAART